MKSFKCPTCSAVSTADAWDSETQEWYGPDCHSITDVGDADLAFFDCPECGGTSFRGDIVEAPRPYDTERGVTWYASLFTEEDAADLPQSDEEITPEAAAELARKYGYDNFEIVRTETEIKRYKTAEVTHK